MESRTEDFFLTDLPNELIVKILSFLTDKEMQSIPLVSQRFYDVASEFFLDNLYGRSIRFNKWQKNKIEKLIAEGRELIELHRVGLLNQPQANAFDKAFYYSRLGGLVLIFFVELCYLLPNLLSSKKMDELFSPSNIALTNITAITLFFTISNTIHLYLNSLTANGQYQASPITSQHLDELDQLARNNPIFINFFPIKNLQEGAISVSQLLAVSQSCIDNIINLSKELDHYLKNSTRMSARKQFSPQDKKNLYLIHPSLPVYAKCVFMLWSDSHIKSPLRLVDSVEEDHAKQEENKIKKRKNN